MEKTIKMSTMSGVNYQRDHLDLKNIFTFTVDIKRLSHEFGDIYQLILRAKFHKKSDLTGVN